MKRKDAFFWQLDPDNLDQSIELRTVDGRLLRMISASLARKMIKSGEVFIVSGDLAEAVQYFEEDK